MEDFTEQTPLTVGSPGSHRPLRQHAGALRRLPASSCSLMDHAGLPLNTACSSRLDILGEEVVPVLRKEFAKNRPANVPDGPTHAARVAAEQASRVELVETSPAEN